eukprot:2671714-Rhodomonas_salina.2
MSTAVSGRKASTWERCRPGEAQPVGTAVCECVCMCLNVCVCVRACVFVCVRGIARMRRRETC